MTKLERLSMMEKNAAAPWLKNVGKAMGIGTGVYFLGDVAGRLGEDVVDISHKGNTGLGSQARWAHEHEKLMRRRIGSDKVDAAKKRQELFGLGGLATGAGTAFGFTRSPIMAIGGALAGRALGKFVGERTSPTLQRLKMDPMKASIADVAGAFGTRDLKRLNEILSMPEIEADPELRNTLIRHYAQATRSDTEYQRYKKRKKTGRVVGSILGSLAMLAAMRYGPRPGLINKPTSPNVLREFANKKGLRLEQARKYLEPTKFQKSMGGNTYWPWAGLGIGGLALGAAKNIEGGRRAKIDSKNIAEKTLDQILSQSGTNLLFYGRGPRI